MTVQNHTTLGGTATDVKVGKIGVRPPAFVPYDISNDWRVL